MESTSQFELNYRPGLRALGKAWRPLLAYELIVSLLTTLVVGPLWLTITYQTIAILDEGGLGNWDLIWFFATPKGALALLLGTGVTLGMLFIEYSGLILLADAALRGTTLSLRQLLVRMLGAAPRLFGLATWQAGLTILAALPFVGVAIATYWLLLGEADINYYVDRQPPRFWVAVSIGIFLALGLGLCVLWFALRWSFTVPASALDRQGWRTALQSSARLVQGRAWRLLLIFGGWQLLKHLLFVPVVAGLDYVNKVFSPVLEQGLNTLVATTVGLLLFDALVLEVLRAIFAIGLAALVALEYERATQAQPDYLASLQRNAAPAATPEASRVLRWGVLLLLLVGPVISLWYALALESELVPHRVVQVTAHRAGPKPAPENSLAALRAALDAKSDFVEIDVQETSDGHVVLLHDRDLRRVTGDSRDLANVSLAELAELRLRSSTGATDERVPTLAEFIAACGDKIRINIELKEFGAGHDLSNRVLAVLRETEFVDRVVVSSFEMPLLVQIKQGAPEVPVGIILTAGKGDLSRLPVNFLSLNQRLVSTNLVRRAHQRGLEVHAWTVNDRELALRLMDLGCDNLITSNPALLREVVDWYAQLGDAERMLMRLRRWMRE